MIAIPIQSNSVDSEVAPLVYNAEWFAFIDEDKKVVFWKNDLKSDKEVLEHFKTIGVDDVIFKGMIADLFNLLNREGIRCHTTGDDQLICSEAIVSYRYQKLIKVSGSNAEQYVING
jgi:predicted Fe-Mo cluster-binding NifX family protein